MKIKVQAFDYLAMIQRVEFPQALCVVFCILLLWVWVGEWFTANPLSVEQSVSMVQQQLSEKDIQKALALPIFGKYVATLSADQVLQKSTIGLHLVGIMYSPSSEASSQVVIRSSDGEEHSYSVGDRLPGGVTIEKIEANRVILRNDDVLEELRLPELKLHFESPEKPLIQDNANPSH